MGKSYSTALDLISKMQMSKKNARDIIYDSLKKTESHHQPQYVNVPLEHR